MRDLQIAEVTAIRPAADTLQQLLSMKMAEPQELNARLVAAVEHQINVQQDAQGEALRDQRVANRIVEAAVDQVITELLDPTRRVTASGLDESMAAALNDVTKTLSEEAANTMERCRAAITMFQDQMNGRDQLVCAISDRISAPK
jgi:pyrimidine deaminase RibD-like protein